MTQYHHRMMGNSGVTLAAISALAVLLLISFAAGQAPVTEAGHVNPGGPTAMSIDMQPSAAPANTNGSVGSRESCARINENGILDADEADVQLRAGNLDSATATTLTDSPGNFGTDGFVGDRVLITTGPTAPQEAVIVSNTNTQLTVAGWSNGTPSAGNQYTVRAVDGLQLDVTVDDVTQYSDNGTPSDPSDDYGGLLAFVFDFEYDETPLTAKAASPGTGMLATTPGSSMFDGSDQLPDTSGDNHWPSQVLDTSATPPEAGDGYLNRVTLGTDAGAAAGVYSLSLGQPAILDVPGNAYEPENVNNALVAVDMDCPDPVDLKVTSATAASPANAQVGVPFNVNVDATVHNNGPATPVNADVQVTLNLGPDCSGGTNPVTIQDQSLATSVALSMPQQTFSVTCSQASNHQFRATVDVVLDDLTAGEINPANNSTTTSGVVTPISADADLKVTAVSVSAPDSQVGTSFEIWASPTHHNNGPDGPVTGQLTANLVAPADCSIASANPVQFAPPLGLSIGTTWTPGWTVTCNNPGFHTFTVNASVAAVLHVNDPAGGNNSGSGLDTNTIAAPYPGEIHGTKWADNNSNGIRNGGEPGLPGVQICLYSLTPPDEVGTLLSCNATTGSGAYQFINLPAGFYRVAETVPSGRSQTYPANGQPHFVEIQSASITGVDFGNAGVPPGAIQGTKFNDANGNGVDDGESGVSGISICIHPAGQCTATNSNGDYSFPAVPPGSHQVYEVLPPGSVNTTPSYVSITVSSGVTSMVNFGNRVPTPPPPEVTVQTGYSVGGIPMVFGGNTTYTKDVTGHCGAASPTQVKLVINSPYGSSSQMMTNTTGEIWSVSMTPGSGGSNTLTFYVDCPPDTVGFPEDISCVNPPATCPEDEIQQGGNIYVDPSGTIYDECSGEPLDGATVTLVRESPPDSDNFVSPASSAHIPADNPEITATDGAYGWVVIPGTYKVVASKSGYVTGESAELSIPPAVTDLNLTLASATDGDCDGVLNASDNCATIGNPGQENFDADAFGDVCDANDDNDLFSDTVEGACGSDALNAARLPERIDGIFAGVSDDGDAQIDEPLPAGVSNFDCDGDGYKGSAEDHVFSYLSQTNGDQKICQEYDTSFPNLGPIVRPSKRWPSDLATGNPPPGFTSLNKINIQDLAAFIGPIRYLNQDIGTDPNDVRFDLVPLSQVGFDINVGDMAALVSASSGFPPMLGGAKAFNGPLCPYAP